ncbi:MAG: hypothetical protein JSS81_23165 [Acidobacteria bacterium]|nr:hypothetical protein [Acidobacteriota bacterium]
MNKRTLVKSLGISRRQFLRVLAGGPLARAVMRAARGVGDRLVALGLAELAGEELRLTAFGRAFIDAYHDELFAGVPDDRARLLDGLVTMTPAGSGEPGKFEFLFLDFLAAGPRPEYEIRNAAPIVPNLIARGLIRRAADGISLTKAGRAALAACPPEFLDRDPAEIFRSLRPPPGDARKIARAAVFVEQFNSGLDFAQIAEKNGLSPKTVMEIISHHPDYSLILESRRKEREKRGVERRERRAAERREEREAARRERTALLRAQSLGGRFPERIAELWDAGRNAGRDPFAMRQQITFKIWLRCPRDGYSWSRTVFAVQQNWAQGKSGCPACRGRFGKGEKPSLSGSYPEMIERFWDWEANPGLDPQRIGRRDTVRLRCDCHGHEWSSSVWLLVDKFWKRGRTGCPACDGEPRAGSRKAEASIFLERAYPELVAGYWDSEKNSLNGLVTRTMKSDSDKIAWFKCPVDGCEWTYRIHLAVRQWENGENICPRCRGAREPQPKTVMQLYPRLVKRLWDHLKNKPLGLDPALLVTTSTREVCLKCPRDGAVWQVPLESVVGKFWSRGLSGCPKCG